MLEISGIYAGYGDNVVLRDVNLSVGKGEIVALLGSNNAGKSTVLNSISGLVKATAGDMELDGKRFNAVAAHDRVGMGLVQVPEARRLFPKMTVHENLLIGAFNPRAREKRPESLERVHALFPRLKERAKQKAGTLSGGEQQMVTMGRALMADPLLLMLDEPSLGLAPKVVNEVMRVVRALSQDGLPVLLVEQNMALALSYATRGYVLERGEIVVEGDSDALQSSPAARRAYLGL